MMFKSRIHFNSYNWAIKVQATKHGIGFHEAVVLYYAVTCVA